MDSETAPALLVALGQLVQALAEPRPLTPEIRQALDDILNIYGHTGQIAEVIHTQRDELAAMTTAVEQLQAAITAHDTRSTEEREQIRDLMIQVIELQRKQVRQLDHLERRVGMTQAERAALRDARPEEDAAA